MARLAALYSTAAAIGLGAVLLLVLLNLLALPLVKGPGEPRVPSEEELARLERVYPGMARQEIRELVAETRGRPYVYEAFTQFRERPYRGRFYTIEAVGYRRSEPQAPWPPPPGGRSLFVFGGSTAFGYGQPDAATIPSHLARTLAAAGCPTGVYNFARSNYYSSQERILFQQLAASGRVPDAAVFLDGLNEFLYASDVPKFTRRLAYMMEETGPQIARRALVGLPLVRLLRAWLPDRNGATDGVPPDPSQAEAVVARWLTNRRLSAAVAAELGVAALFIWQPVPEHGYDLANHLFADRSGAPGPSAELLRRGYELIDRQRPALEAAGGFLWLADLQRGRGEPLYVDRYHYSESFSAEIAAHIAAALRPALCPEAGDERPR